MTTQKNRMTRFHGVRIGASNRRRSAATTALSCVALAACIVPALGCKTGTSLAKPSWWTFGGTPKADADSLAAAPPYSGDIKKPSESAKQYPTTSTPSGYVITGTAGTSGAVPPQFQSAQPQAPVVYGSTPLPASPQASAIAETSPAAMPRSPAPSSVAPQVGPYAALAGDSIPPPGQPLPPIAPSTVPATMPPSMPSAMPSMANTGSTPAEAALPNTAYSSFSAPNAGSAYGPMTGAPMGGAMPPPRMADARAVDPAAALPAAALPVEQPSYGGSRYSSSGGSRFGGAEAASFSPGPAVAAPPAAPYAPPAAPPSTPGLLQPSGQPVRRPDPGYRPGGTSSYRPSRTILADESAPPTAVRTASYEETNGTVQQ